MWRDAADLSSVEWAFLACAAPRDRFRPRQSRL